VVYRPGYETVRQRFFDELAAVLDNFATYQMPFYVVGDFNVRLDRRNDLCAVQLRLLVDCYGLLLHDTEPTHELDAVITHDENRRPDYVTVVDLCRSCRLRHCLTSEALPPTLSRVRSDAS